MKTTNTKALVSIAIFVVGLILIGFSLVQGSKIEGVDIAECAIKIFLIMTFFLGCAKYIK